VSAAGGGAGVSTTAPVGMDVSAAGGGAGASTTLPVANKHVSAAGGGAAGGGAAAFTDDFSAGDGDDDWAASINIVNLDAREGKEQILEYYDNATLSAIELEDNSWASVLSEQVEEEMSRTNDTKHKNKLRRVADMLTGILWVQKLTFHLTFSHSVPFICC